MPDVIGVNKDTVIAGVVSRSGCWRCPAACHGNLKEGEGDYKYPANTRRPDYETLAALGCMCLNTHTDSIAMANHLCNIYGIDTISTGTIIAFAMECYEHGIITKADTDGLELTWGNHRTMIGLLEKICKREGIGAVLADGVKVAAQRLGNGAEAFAVHAGGQELGMHDPKADFAPFRGLPMAALYKMDAAPGRHTGGFGPTHFLNYLLNAAGLCLHGNFLGYAMNREKYLRGFMALVTGWDRSLEELARTGERIANMRHVFTLREGDNPLQRSVHPRIV
jgi:aldehyde:ferredoxin oxidoreductase